MSKKIGIAMIGTGFARKVQMPAFRDTPGAELVSVASGSLENAKAAAEEFGIAHFTADWRESVGRGDVDLVVITTPPNLHREMTLFAFEHGKHVLCEKPMAMDTAEAEEMTEAARRSGTMALIDHELRFQPGRQKARSMISDGAIGSIRHAKYNFRAPHRGDPNVPWSWWSDEKQGGGTLGAINSHIIDSFNWLLGTRIESVFCQLQTHIKQRPDNSGAMRPVTSDDEANMILRFEDAGVVENATGLASVSMIEQPSYQNEIEIFGTKGAIRIGHRGDVFLAENGASDWTQVPADLGQPIDGVADTGFSRGFTALSKKLIEALQQDRTDVEFAATFEDGLEVQRILDASRRSSRDGCAVRIERPAAAAG